ncbi:MAG: GNAT family N-acetyltransferase [bacterium]
MSIVIREADPKADRQAMMDCLLRNRTRYEENDAFVARFDWAYRDNPHGHSKAWLALDQSKNQVVGFTSAFPRRVMVDSKPFLGWNCADFSIDQEYRTLGVAMKLRRAAKDCVDRGEFDFLFAHPNERMRAVHEKVGHQPIGKMVRYAALLRLENKLEALVGNKIAAHALAALGNPFLQFITPGRSRTGPYDFALVEEKTFGAEYDRLFEKVLRQHRVLVQRDAGYLTWRFLHNPLYRTTSFRMQAGGELKGYVLFHEAKGVAHVMELLVEGQQEERQLLMRALMQHLRRVHVNAISLRLHDLNPMLATAQQLGFRYRDDATSTVITYANAAQPYAATVLDGKNWFMTVGDRDI